MHLAIQLHIANRQSLSPIWPLSEVKSIESSDVSNLWTSYSGVLIVSR